MARAHKSMDVRDIPELIRLAREVHESGEFRILREGDKELAMILPMEPPVSYPWRDKTEEDYEAFRSSAGGWKGIVDVEQILKDNEESRRISTRPPVEL